MKGRCSHEFDTSPCPSGVPEQQPATIPETGRDGRARHNLFERPERGPKEVPRVTKVTRVGARFVQFFRRVYSLGFSLRAINP